MKVAFIVMPFASIYRPSIGVSLLKAALKEEKIDSKIYYFNHNFACLIGKELYDSIAEQELSHTSLIGELIFSGLLFEKSNLSFRKELKTVLNMKLIGKESRERDRIFRDIVDIQKHLLEYILDSAKRVTGDAPDLIGFTTTFHQNCASLCLSKEIKRQYDIPIIFGGANCEGEMGFTILRTMPWIDYVCSGEGDLSFLQFVKNLGKDNKKIPGILTRESSLFDIVMTNPVMDMNTLPFPDYDDFYNSISDHFNDLSKELAIETSRGCWWGEKFQCTFCGLNGSNMKFRSKSIPRVISELEYLNEKYKETKFGVVDNIMDFRYIRNLFFNIKKYNMDIELFFETKSNLLKQDLVIMRSGGVNAIQPGIESLSDKILKIMNKGVTALQNIQLLKWCRQIGITPHWNFLYGFPGEPADEYDKMANIIPSIVHLQPPAGCGKIILDRFSPYFVEPEKYGIANCRPIEEYEFVYPLEKHYLYKLAYHFNYDYKNNNNLSEYTIKLKEEVSRWKWLWKYKIPTLNMVSVKDQLMIMDTRPCATRQFCILSAIESKLYMICDSMYSLQNIIAGMRNSDLFTSEKEIEELLLSLVTKKLMLKDEQRYLSLAVQRQPM